MIAKFDKKFNRQILSKVLACHLVITGLVQGVFFRVETQRKARELGLTGWVRNCRDGSVEIHAEGPAEKLQELEQWCQTGPPRAMVGSVRMMNASEQQYVSFEIMK